MISDNVQNYKPFKNNDYYTPKNSSYYLLPFRFKTLKNGKELLVNDIGEYLIVPSNTAKAIVRKKISFEMNRQLYSDLISKFFISTKPIPDLLDVYSSRYNNKRFYLNGFTGLHIFVITLRCDQTCNYCQVSRVTDDTGSQYDMSKETIKRGIDLMMRSPSKDVTMEFQGGEPLLVFERIKFSVKHAEIEAKKYNKNINFVICTNLSLVNDETLAFCKEYEIAISTSLDGPPKVHNANRPRLNGDSYKIAVNGILKSKEYLGEEYVSALMTTTKLSLDYPKEIVDTYLKLGFKEIFLRSISPYGFALKSKKKTDYSENNFFEFYKKALLYIIELNKQGIEIQEVFAQIILRKILTPYSSGFVDLVSPAGIINAAIVFNYNDLVYASDESRMLSEMGDEEFMLGNIHETTYEDIFYGEKAKAISEIWNNESLTGCSDCVYQPYCGTDPVSNWATQGSMEGFRPTNEFCNKNMKIFEFLFDLMENDDYTMQLFRKWSNRN